PVGVIAPRPVDENDWRTTIALHLRIDVDAIQLAQGHCGPHSVPYHRTVPSLELLSGKTAGDERFGLGRSCAVVRNGRGPPSICRPSDLAQARWRSIAGNPL